jgi:hypothetical protein
MIRPSANGLFMGAGGNNGAFYRAANNFGLTFFGQESRTASAYGFGLVAGDLNGGGGARIAFLTMETMIWNSSPIVASEEIVGIYEAGLNGKDLTQAKRPRLPSCRRI